MAYRIDKLEHLLKEEVSMIFLYKLHDPAFGLITVTNVKISPDLKIAKIYISVFEKEKRDAVIERIRERTGFIRTELAHRIRIKFIPELKFFIDDTMDYVEKIEGLIKQIHKNDNKENNES